MTSGKRINLALQGGGSHGAFTWGVLDGLLDDDRIEIEGVSATSAGAMNAAVMAHGLAVGGRDGAREALAGFWRAISDAALLSPLQPTPLDRLLHNHNLDSSPAHILFDVMSRLFSPYETNPLDINPLRALLSDHVDLDRIHSACPVKLFVCATNVRTGKIKVFENTEIGVDHILASSCLPMVFQAVEIDGEAYWDGGYMGNPAIYPLIYECGSRDVMIVHINPIEREDVPKTARDILNRINEVSFNSTLIREMRAIAFVTKLIDNGDIAEGAMKRMLIHSIEDEAFMSELGVSSKLHPDWEFLTHLRDVGRSAVERWLEANFDSLGVESTVDIRAKYL